MASSNAGESPSEGSGTDESPDPLNPTGPVELRLKICGGIIWLACCLVSWMSWNVRHASHSGWFVAIFGLIMFPAWIVTLKSVVNQQLTRSMLMTIVLFSIAFRVVLLFSWPILEIDLYRYIWDGQVLAAGGDPYQFSPDEVKAAQSTPARSLELQRLASLSESQTGVDRVLKRVHFSELRTAYPPVSQLVFAAAAITTPYDADVSTLVLVIKIWIVIFDLLTLLVIGWVLRKIGWSRGWLVAYGWCPLVLKEFANTGHLDSIAVFWCTLAAAFFLNSLQTGGGTSERGMRHGLFPLFACAVSLALGIGAKLFPVVIAPLLGSAVLWHRGWRAALGVTSGCVVCTLLLLAPMAWHHVSASVTTNADTSMNAKPKSPMAGELGASNDALDPDGDEGLTAFLSRWKMNDFLFMLLFENLQSDSAHAPDQRPWFVLIPAQNRDACCNAFVSATGLNREFVPFFIARSATLLLCLVIQGAWAWKYRTSTQPKEWGEGIFLALAWFWLLLPTQNPWYLTWAMPFLMFARNRTWWYLSGFAFVYYLRFGFRYLWPDSAVLPTVSPYTGVTMYDYVVVWLEFGPWFAVLFLTWIKSKKRVDSMMNQPA